ncbi:MAG: glycosyltransferase family 2 protein [Betaproteobacteria bacterium]|nr:glycosyltransferase family 2 protein [Betaproteobacteria bacterium]
MSDQAKATDRSPLVSVVIACYNCERYIAKAIDSILHQSMSDFEIIVVDDCSSDASRAVVAAYEDSRVSLVALSQNSGPSKARNEGVRRAW